MRTFEWAGGSRADRFIFVKKRVPYLKVVPKKKARLGWVVRAGTVKRTFEKEKSEISEYYK